MPTNKHYATALNELVEKRPVQGLFARCFAEADGDEAKTKARYIALRASEIEGEERTAHEARAEESRKREAALAEELRQREKARQKLLDSFTFEQFRKEYRGEISLNYYGWPEQRVMFKQWQEEKLRSHGVADESTRNK